MKDLNGKKKIILFFACISSIISFGQNDSDKNYFELPIHIPIQLSGNVGEIRINQLHTGMDIRTEGKEGFDIYAAADGYIERIKVDEAGYGRAVYIAHPNGFTTVYGHLQRFEPPLAEYVKEQQYKQRSFTVDLFPNPDEFRVHKGEIIAKSGNAGMSSGPHLHFELRNTGTQNIINILKFNFNIIDTTSPDIHALWIYPQDSGAVNGSNLKTKFKPVRLHQVKGEKNLAYVISSKDSIVISGRVGFALETTDRIGNSSNLGVYSIQLYIDSLQIFYESIDEIPYSELRYTNSLMDYEEKLKNNYTISKQFIAPNNKYCIYKSSVNNGFVTFNDNKVHTVLYIIKDCQFNETHLTFKVRGKDQYTRPNDYVTPTGILMCWNKPGHYENNDLRITIPEGSLYENLYFNYDKIIVDSGFYSDIHMIHNIYTPVHKTFTIAIKSKNLPEILKNRAIVVLLDKNNKISGSYTGEWKNEYLTVQTKSFGDYAIVADTTAPTITPVRFNKDGDLSKFAAISFSIRDELSGIKKYEGKIDGNWVLFEYDAKNNLLTYTFDLKRLKTGIKHILELTVTDKVDNVATYKADFFR